MGNNKQLFVFNMPVEEVVFKISRYPVHFFAGTIDGMMLMANDMQAELFKLHSANNIVGKCIFELMRKINMRAKEKRDVMIHNISVLDKNMPQLFNETAAGKECLCIKSPLLSSRKRTIGIGGIAFYFHQIASKDMVVLINKLFSLNTITNCQI